MRLSCHVANPYILWFFWAVCTNTLLNFQSAYPGLIEALGKYEYYILLSKIMVSYSRKKLCQRIQLVRPTFYIENQARHTSSMNTINGASLMAGI